MIKMKKLIASGLFCGALLMGSVGGAFAGPDRTMPGMPRTANCVGQTNAFLAQVGQEAGITGIGGIAKANDLSVKEVQQIVQNFCNPQP